MGGLSEAETSTNRGPLSGSESPPTGVFYRVERYKVSVVTKASRRIGVVGKLDFLLRSE